MQFSFNVKKPTTLMSIDEDNENDDNDYRRGRRSTDDATEAPLVGGLQCWASCNENTQQ